MPLAVGPAMTTRGGLEDGMGIATLIAAGRLDDRTVDRALGLLREVDPKAAFAGWIDEGDSADLSFSGDFKSARWALEGVEGLDVVVQNAEPRWRKLFVADMAALAAPEAPAIFAAMTAKIAPPKPAKTRPAAPKVRPAALRVAKGPVMQRYRCASIC